MFMPTDWTENRETRGSEATSGTETVEASAQRDVGLAAGTGTASTVATVAKGPAAAVWVKEPAQEQGQQQVGETCHVSPQWPSCPGGSRTRRHRTRRASALGAHSMTLGL
jgi:hypothetical protein